MKYTKLGRTDLDVSAVSFGTGSLGEMFGPVDDGQADAIVGRSKPASTSSTPRRTTTAPKSGWDAR